MMLHDVDQQVEQVITTVRSVVERRRRAFAADLYQQFEVVQAIIHNPEALETHRREAARLDEASEQCAAGARRAMSARSALIATG